MKTANEININNVTPEQIGKAFKVFDLATGKPFYQVESERDETVEYKVSWTRETGFTCSCPAGQEGFVHCKDGVCKHVKWALAAAREEKEALAALVAASCAPAKPEPECEVPGCKAVATDFDGDRVIFVCKTHR